MGLNSLVGLLQRLSICARVRVADQQAQSYAPPPPPAPAAAPGAGSDTVARLQELANLHASGVQSDDEFAAAKREVLAGE